MRWFVFRILFAVFGNEMPVDGKMEEEEKMCARSRKAL